jgi:hypothetical protein
MPTKNTSKKRQFDDLPFMGPDSFWEHDIPEGYAEACAAGNQDAMALIEYLHENPDEIGSNLLGIIAKDVDYHDRDKTGYWVGFFTIVEILAARL